VLVGVDGLENKVETRWMLSMTKSSGAGVLCPPWTVVVLGRRKGHSVAALD